MATFIGRMLGLRPSYLIRLDDACETQDAEKWKAVERVLDRFGIKPIVAVIPKNEDPTLQLGKRNELFWSDVKEWQAKGWCIALHGHTHRYHPVDRRQLILPFYDRSEFAGRTLEDQAESLRAAYRIFLDNGIKPAVWVAPGHSFDSVTLAALKRATDITVVSDGIACRPFSEDGFTFVPQQLWWPKPKLSGTWTICLHPNTMNSSEIERLEAALEKGDFGRRFITLEQALQQVRRKGVCSALYARLFWFRWNLSHH